MRYPEATEHLSRSNKTAAMWNNETKKGKEQANFRRGNIGFLGMSPLKRGCIHGSLLLQKQDTVQILDSITLLFGHRSERKKKGGKSRKKISHYYKKTWKCSSTQKENAD